MNSDVSFWLAYFPVLVVLVLLILGPFVSHWIRHSDN